MSVVSEDEFLSMSLTVKSKTADRAGFAIELRRDGHYYVKTVPPGFSGCRPGDRILEVNGTSCSSFKSQKHANALIDTFHMEIVPVDNDLFDDVPGRTNGFIPQKGRGAPSPSNQVSSRARNMPNQMNSPNGVGKKHLPESLKSSVQKKNVPKKHMPHAGIPPARGGDDNLQRSPTRAQTSPAVKSAKPVASNQPPKGNRRRETVEYLSTSEDSGSDESSDDGTETVDSDGYDEMSPSIRQAIDPAIESPKQANEHGKRGNRREAVEDISASDDSSNALDDDGYGGSMVESEMDDEEDSVPESKDMLKGQTRRDVVEYMSASDDSFVVHVSDASDEEDDNYIRSGNEYVPSEGVQFNSHPPMHQERNNARTSRRDNVEYRDSDTDVESEGSSMPQGKGERRDVEGYHDSDGDSESGSESDDHQVSPVQQNGSNAKPSGRRSRDVVEYHDSESESESSDESDGLPFHQAVLSNAGNMEPKGGRRIDNVEYHDSESGSESDYHQVSPVQQNGSNTKPSGRRRRDVVEYHDSENDGEDESGAQCTYPKMEQNGGNAKPNGRKRRDVVEYHESDSESHDEPNGPSSSIGRNVAPKGRKRRDVVEYHDSDTDGDKSGGLRNHDPRTENGRKNKPQGRRRRDVVEYHESDDESDESDNDSGGRSYPTKQHNGGNGRQGRNNIVEYHDSDSDTVEPNGGIVQPNRKGRRDITEYQDSESEEESMPVSGNATEKNHSDRGISMSSSDDFSLPGSDGSESESVSIATSCQSDDVEYNDGRIEVSGNTPDSRTRAGRRTDDVPYLSENDKASSNSRNKSGSSAPRGTKTKPRWKDEVEYLPDSDSDSAGSNSRSKSGSSAPRGTKTKPRWKDEVEYLPDSDCDSAGSNSRSKSGSSAPRGTKTKPRWKDEVEYLPDSDSAGSNSRSKSGSSAPRGTKTKPRWKDEVEYLPDSDSAGSNSRSKSGSSAPRGTKTKPRWKDEVESLPDSDSAGAISPGSRRKSKAVVDDGYASSCDTCPLCGSQLSLAGDGVEKMAHNGDPEGVVVNHDDDDESIGVEEVQAVQKQSRNQLSQTSLLHSSARLRDSRRSFQPEGDWDRPYVSNYKPMDRWMVTVKIDPEYDSGLTIVPYEDELYVADIDFGPFYDTGLDTGDKILSINGKKVPKDVSTVEDAEVLIESREKTTLFVLRPDPEDEGYRWVKGVL
eukprot:Nitzschia sp. Nitz4//scaffold3_size479765//323054//326845//NITZ4_000133-RA/size479765-augustus-gene-1.612-mRNA-1//-1//CDS//3329550857//729//frame0